MTIYYPKTIAFIKNRAKHLQANYPELQLSLCLEATSRALGFQDWFDAMNRISAPRVAQSACDEYVSETVKMQRSYQQSKALIDITRLPPDEIDDFVNHWNLTSISAPAFREHPTLFECVLRDLIAYEHGEVSIDASKRPVRIRDGIILSKHHDIFDRYVLSNQRLIDMPIYLRGNLSIFSGYEEYYHVILAFADEFTKEEIRDALDSTETCQPRLYEWHTGRTAKSFRGISIADMVNDAVSNPEEWFALSYRRDDGSIKLKYYIPAIKGSDFIKFIDNKGSLLDIQVKWFRCEKGYKHKDVNHEFSDHEKTVRIDLTKLTEVDPILSSPFKYGPMGNFEYSIERESHVWIDRAYGGIMKALFDERL